MEFLNNNLIIGVVGIMLFCGWAFFLLRQRRKNLPQSIAGIVTVGSGLGDLAGARTANLDTGLAQNLPDGLYSCRVVAGSESYPGLLYSGLNSLSKKKCLEAHILDFNQDLYGRQITITNLEFMRRPKKFKTIKALRGQVEKDLIKARKRFNK